MCEIILASGNPHKVIELRAIFARADLRILGLTDLPGAKALREPDETGTTFDENAGLKALAYADQTGRVCLADDSGLEVDALDGAPGVFSARYAVETWPDGADRDERDRLNNRKLLAALDGVAPSDRGARFVCAMALAAPGRLLVGVRGTFEGRIGSPPTVPRGSNGFGYDPLFLVGPEHAVTSAELTPDRKNAISHRARAALQMADIAPDLLRRMGSLPP